MIILGIDPGTERAGYGVIRQMNGKPELVDAGILSIRSREPAERLLDIKRELDELCAAHEPDLVAVEKLFFLKNVTTGIAVAEARGVVLLAAAERGIPIREIAPTEVKMGVAGYGHADKASVLKMVRLILGTRELDIVDDAADALALALVAAQHTRGRD